jgi:hypothetical protein
MLDSDNYLSNLPGKSTEQVQCIPIIDSVINSDVVTAPVLGTLTTGWLQQCQMMLTPLAKAINMKATSYNHPEVIEGQLLIPCATTTIATYLDG